MRPTELDDYLFDLRGYLISENDLLFSDGIAHGASSRTTPGERRVVIYRYGVSWGNTRYGYRYSDELLARLTPERQKFCNSLRPASHKPHRPKITAAIE